jgi:16S rRNA (cytosine1402-N4)-methyltransferase
MAVEVVSQMAPRSDGLYIDCTLGWAGHTLALLQAGAGRVIGLDRDPLALDASRVRLAPFGDRVVCVHSDYRALPDVLAARGVTAVDGVLADLGVSSMQIDDAARGFSFKQDGPLDMRMDPTSGAPLSDRLADVDEATLADVIFEYGEERHARRIARAIVAARAEGRLTRTGDLAAIVRRAAGRGAWQRIDPATRTFQALRVWVNDELSGLEAFLRSAVAALVAGGRLVVIAFHSLEDRVVKHTFRSFPSPRRDDAPEDPIEAVTATVRARVLTKRPVTPGDAEQARNPRARSAKLRVIERVA